MPASQFMSKENILKTDPFENDDSVINVWFPANVLLEHKSKMTVDCGVFFKLFLWHCVDGTQEQNQRLLKLNKVNGVLRTI